VESDNTISVIGWRSVACFQAMSLCVSAPAILLPFWRFWVVTVLQVAGRDCGWFGFWRVFRGEAGVDADGMGAVSFVLVKS
jgi:hypothetical protein